MCFALLDVICLDDISHFLAVRFNILACVCIVHVSSIQSCRQSNEQA